MVWSRFVAVSAVVCGLTAPAFAEPVLQLYVEGATYDQGGESWLYDGGAIRLWVIADTAPTVRLENVRLAAGYAAADGVVVSLTPSTTGGYGGFADPSTPAAPALVGAPHTDGGQPSITASKQLPKHGYYGAGVHWQEFALGDFTLTDSPIADFIDSFPAPHATHTGQINVYDVAISGLVEGALVHFDVYGVKDDGRRESAVFAPFSHDAFAVVAGPVFAPPETDPRLDPVAVPEPGALAALAAGLVLLSCLPRRRRSGASARCDSAHMCDTSHADPTRGTP